MTLTTKSPWVALLLVAGCFGEGDRSLPHLSNDAPLPLEKALFYTATNDSGDNRAVVADLAHKRPRAVSYALPAGTPHAFTRPGSARSEVVLLTSGTRATRDGDKIRAEVPAYALRFDRAGEVARYPLGGRFDALTLSTDGRFALASSPQSGLAEDVALVDFGSAGEDGEASGSEVHGIGLRLLDGAEPTGFVFGPAADRRLLVALMPNSFSILDLAKLDVSEPDVVVPLAGTSPNDVSRTPNKILFGDDTLYVQSNGVRDVLMVQLLPSTSEARGFTVAPLRLATSTAVADIALLDDDSGTHVLAVGAGKASVLAPLLGSGQELTVPTSLNQIVLFRASSPADDQVRQRALLVGQGRDIAFLDISDDGLLGSEGLQVITAVANVVSVSAVPELGLAVLLHSDRSFSVLDLAQRTVSRLNATDAVSALQLDVGNGHARLWYALSAGSLGVIDLDTRRPTELLFSQDVNMVVPLGGDDDWVAAISTSAAGSAAVVDGDALDRGPLWELHGFTWSGLLD